MMVSPTYFDHLLVDMLERPQGFMEADAHVFSAHCQQNMEAFLSTYQSDSDVFSHIEVHQQGPYRRSSADDLASMITMT